MQIGLALSGGGLRAAAFHSGVLRRLAVQGEMENVSTISTVSGASLMLAAVFRFSDLLWPSSQRYLEDVYPRLRILLATLDLASIGTLRWRDVARSHVRLFNHRASVLVDLLETRWLIEGRLPDLPVRPVWWINATSLPTGKNWRFSRGEMGDWKFGRHYAPTAKIAEAVAASAAVPYVIGALKLSLPTSGWYRTDPATKQPVEAISVASAVRLWDGGAYENLGLEPLFKAPGTLTGCDFLICCDASTALGPQLSPVQSLIRGDLGAPRLFDIAADQIRSLRARSLIGALASGVLAGAYVRMGNSVEVIDRKTSRTRETYAHLLGEAEVEAASTSPTHLRALTIPAFDTIARHGFEAADATLTAHRPSEFTSSFRWPSAA